MTQACRQCQHLFTDQRKPSRKGKVRPRRCRECMSRAVVEKRRNDPIRGLQHKWKTTCKKYWPRAEPYLWNKENVSYVYNRWDKKSVISKSGDSICISYIVKVGIPKVEELVLLTSSEAMRLGKKGDEDRRKSFPEEIRNLIQKKERVN